MPLVVGEEGGGDEAMLHQPVDHRAIAGSALIDRPDAEFGLHARHVAQRVARPFADGQVVPLRIHLQERPGKAVGAPEVRQQRSEEHTSELQALMRISYAVFCLKKKKQNNTYTYYLSVTNGHYRKTLRS